MPTAPTFLGLEHADDPANTEGGWSKCREEEEWVKHMSTVYQLYYNLYALYSSYSLVGLTQMETSLKSSL